MIIVSIAAIIREFSMSSKKEALDLLKSLKIEVPEKKEVTEEPVEKALTAHMVSGIAKRARLHEYAAKVVQDTEYEGLGTTRRSENGEPPVVPVRRVEAPQPANRPFEIFKSCDSCGTMFKSTSDCPRCEYNSFITEAKDRRFDS